MRSDAEQDDMDGIIYHAPRKPHHSSSSSSSLRSRIFGGMFGGATERHRERHVKMISTRPGMLGAGETETEADEPPTRLPTSRILPSSAPLIPPTSLQERLTPLLFDFSRLLSVVPAVLGTLYNIYFAIYSEYDADRGGSRKPESVDFAVAALWSILTGIQCLALTTGLLTRWKIYYAPISTLVRLLALQAICWPATHWTLRILDGGMFEGTPHRPVIVWAIIGTTTSISRSIQIWVTSNLWWEKDAGSTTSPSHLSSASATTTATTKSPLSASLNPSSNTTSTTTASTTRGYWKRWRGGKWGGRRWDWREVAIKCVLPAGIVYFVMAWAEAVRRDVRGC